MPIPRASICRNSAKRPRGSCHQDHLGLAGMVDRRMNPCAATATPASRPGTKNASQLSDASDFGKAHPEFRVRLPAWIPPVKFAPQLTRLTAGLKENSGLKFNHELHLKPDLNAPSGPPHAAVRQLSRRRRGRPRDEARELRDHVPRLPHARLRYSAPDRQVPHAKVAEVVYMLDDYYAKRALEGGYTEASAPGFVQQRRRPGDAPLSQQETIEALSWARNKSRQVADSVFTGRACVTCHAVSRAAATNVPAPAGRSPPCACPASGTAMRNSRTRSTRRCNARTATQPRHRRPRRIC